MQNMPIGIFRGDDTDAFSYQTIVGTINTDLDLTGCKAVFRYLDFSMEFDPIPEDRKLTIVIPAEETKKFPPGLGYASLRVYDSEGRLKTFSNRIMVFVATKTPMFGSDEFEVDFNVRASLEPLKFFIGPNPDDFDEYRGYVEKVIDRASAEKYGLAILLDAIDSDLGAADGVAATPVAVKAAYAAIIDKLTDDYYTAEETDEAIDRVAAYYITRNAAGNPFPTYAALANAQTVYSGGAVRVPTRNDYCVVLADETHDNAEYRYIYAVAEGQTTGGWQPQYPVEGVMTVDQSVTRNSQNPVSGGGVWSAIWGALAALPTGFASLYDWCVAQIAKLRDKLDLNVYDYGNPVASFADGFSVVDSQGGGTGQRYTAPSGGETITFIGPVPSSNPYLSNYKFYYPSTLGTLDSFDPDNYSVWCLVCLNGGTTPSYMMYRTGPYYYIGSFNSVTPTLTLGMGEATGDAPIMTRPLGATGDTLALASQLAGKVPTSRTVNGKALSSDVTLTGADIAVSGTDPTKIDAALAGKASKSDATLTERGPNKDGFSAWTIVPTQYDDKPLFIKYESDEHAWLLCNGTSADYVIKGLAPGGQDAVSLHWVISSATPGGQSTPVTATRTVLQGYQLGSQTDKPLASEAEAEALRTGKANRAANPTAGNLAALDASGNPTDSTIPAANVAQKSNIPYDRITITTGQLQDHAEQKVTLNAATTTLTLPALTTGKVSDFGIDVVNGYEVSGTPTAASFTLDGTLGTDYNLIVPEGETWSDMTALAPNEMAIYYFTLSAFHIGGLPTWGVTKQVVTPVPVPVAP